MGANVANSKIMLGSIPGYIGFRSNNLSMIFTDIHQMMWPVVNFQAVEIGKKGEHCPTSALPQWTLCCLDTFSLTSCAFPLML